MGLERAGRVVEEGSGSLKARKGTIAMKLPSTRIPLNRQWRFLASSYMLAWVADSSSCSMRISTWFFEGVLSLLDGASLDNGTWHFPRVTIERFEA